MIARLVPPQRVRARGSARFVYRGAHVGFETDSAGTTGMKYVWGLNIDDLIAFEDGSGNHYYVAKDKVGSIRNVATRSGTWAMRLRHKPYGALIDSVGTGVMLRYRWTGREWDAELGWYFMRARHYDPVASRFTQEDPIGFAGGDNLYAYVGGSPLEARDPNGLKQGNVDGPFEGFCFGGGSCVNWDGSVTHGGGGWSFSGGGGGIRRAISEPRLSGRQVCRDNSRIAPAGCRRAPLAADDH